MRSMYCLAALWLLVLPSLSGCGTPTKETGQKINLEEKLVEGQTTVFDFYSEYCGPCRQISPLLEKLDEQRDDLAVVKIDINRPGHKGIDWQGPIAKQFGLQSIPHFKIYGANGKLQAEGRGAAEQIQKWLAETR